MNTLTTQFTSTGVSAAITASRGVMKISGTFVATIKLELADGSTWVDDSTFTAPGAYPFNTEVPQVMRAECSQYTSGTVTVTFDYR